VGGLECKCVLNNLEVECGIFKMYVKFLMLTFCGRFEM
jgi:hypothetical protein